MGENAGDLIKNMHVIKLKQQIIFVLCNFF